MLCVSCEDCLANTTDKFCILCKAQDFNVYMLTDDVWVTQLGLSKRECICPMCLRKLLGRPFELTDFIEAPINELILIILADTNKPSKKGTNIDRTNTNGVVFSEDSD